MREKPHSAWPNSVSAGSLAASAVYGDERAACVACRNIRGSEMHENEGVKAHVAASGGENIYNKFHRAPVIAIFICRSIARREKEISQRERESNEY